MPRTARHQEEVDTGESHCNTHSTTHTVQHAYCHTHTVPCQGDTNSEGKNLTAIHTLKQTPLQHTFCTTPRGGRYSPEKSDCKTHSATHTLQHTFYNTDSATPTLQHTLCNTPGGGEYSADESNCKAGAGDLKLVLSPPR